MKLIDIVLKYADVLTVGEVAEYSKRIQESESVEEIAKIEISALMYANTKKGNK